MRNDGRLAYRPMFGYDLSVMKSDRRGDDGRKSKSRACIAGDCQVWPLRY